MDTKRVSLSFMNNSPMISEHVWGTKENYQKVDSYSSEHSRAVMMRFESRSELYAGNASAFPRLPIVAQIEIIKQMVADIDGDNGKDTYANS